MAAAGAADLVRAWRGYAQLHAVVLQHALGPKLEVWDAAMAQRMEDAGIAAALHSMHIVAAAAAWGGELQQQHRNNIISMGLKAIEYFCPPKTPAFTASSSQPPGGPRISGRQALAAVAAMVVLAEHGVRLAAAQQRALESAFRTGPCHPMAPLCFSLMRRADIWLSQVLPQRPGGPPPTPLVSLLGEGAVVPTFRALLSLLCTQVGTIYHSLPWQGKQ
jgi:hypothetical protein